jgi:hypothetical protein
MNSNTLKTTLYFDQDLYFEIKKKALEERKTITQLIQEMLKKEVKTAIRKKTAFKSELPPALSLGKIKGNLSREEIYDFI